MPDPIDATRRRSFTVPAEEVTFLTSEPVIPRRAATANGDVRATAPALRDDFDGSEPQPRAIVRRTRLTDRAVEQIQWHGTLQAAHARALAHCNLQALAATFSTTPLPLDAELRIR